VTSRSPIRISPALGLLEPGDAAQPRGLPAAEGPSQHEELAVAHLERQLIERRTARGSYRLARRRRVTDATQA